MKGGSLVFEMGNTPNYSYGRQKDNRPVSKIDHKKFINVPLILSGEKIFKGETIIEMLSEDGSNIYYTLDGSLPDENSIKYNTPVIINMTLILRAICIDKEGNRSMVVSSGHTRIAKGLSMKLNSPYNHVYNAGGELALIDKQRGDSDFMSGKWQGWQGIDLDAIIDLGKKQNIRSLTQLAN